MKGRATSNTLHWAHLAGHTGWYPFLKFDKPRNVHIWEIQLMVLHVRAGCGGSIRTKVLLVVEKNDENIVITNYLNHLIGVTYKLNTQFPMFKCTHKPGHPFSKFYHFFQTIMPHIQRKNNREEGRYKRMIWDYCTCKITCQCQLNTLTSVLWTSSLSLLANEPDCKKESHISRLI